MRWLLLALTVSGCGFSIDTGGSLVGDDGPDTQEDAGPETTARMCSTSDPSLRLCIDFDDTANLETDQFGHAVRAENLMPMQRDTGEPAVTVDAESYLHVGESTDLDIPDNLTVSMWISVELGGLPVSNVNSRWLFDNNTQYFGQLRVGGVIRCGIGGEDADSAPILADGSWHHVACTFARDEIRVYVDGHLHDCEGTADRAIPMGGTSGLAIGANVSGTDLEPEFADQFIGGIDNVQLFARRLDPAEVCSAAGGTTCNAVCP
ncbi:MAG: LamG domain-containing protein [Kofleriaceae bacterium]